MSLVKAPDDTPTPATISPTSPLDIIPMPTLIDLALFLRKRSDGSPHPINFVTTAIAIIIPAKKRTSMLTPLRSTCAPIIAKNKGAKIICNLSTYSCT
jgi:hypothetical protein